MMVISGGGLNFSWSFAIMMVRMDDGDHFFDYRFSKSVGQETITAMGTDPIICPISYHTVA